MSKIALKLHDEFDRLIKPAPEVPVITDVEQVQLAKAPKASKGSGVIVDGEAGCLVKFAKCCNPLPGDSVIGFVTKGYGISIHKKDCVNYLNQKDNPIGNIDKYLEPLKDALVHSGIIHDESQIKILHVETHESDGNSRVEVHIEESDC